MLATMNFTKEIMIIKEIVDEYSNKGGLKKPPKVLISKELSLAGVRGLKNELTIGEYLLYQFQKGIFTQDDLRGTIAHEIGHLMPSKLPWYHRIFKYTNVVVCYIALLVILFFSFYFVLPTLLPFTVFLIVSLPFLPYAIKKIERPFELEADRNALYFIDSKLMATSIINKSNQRRKYGLGPLETLNELEEILGHPSLKERLDNIGFKLKLVLEESDCIKTTETLKEAQQNVK